MAGVRRQTGMGAALAVATVLLVGCAQLRPVEPAVPGATPSAVVPTASASASETPTPSAPASSAGLKNFAPPAAPLVSGKAVFGSTLGITVKDWKPKPTTVGYQWLRDGELITDAVAATYKATGNDISHRLSVLVTARKDGYNDSQVKSAQIGPVKAGALKSVKPTIGGTVKVGSTLTGKVDAWGPGTVTLAWQWFREGIAIANATSATYKLAADDYQHPITVTVTGSRQNYLGVAVSSEATAKVGKGTLKPTPAPTISGTVTVGHTLTASAGTWGPGTVKLGYQWYRNTGRSDIAIDGATGTTYKVAAADAGSWLRVRVTGSRTAYQSAAVFSVRSAQVGKGTISSATPKVSGRVVVGQTLTADPGSWSPAPITLAYQWYRDGRVIVRENNSTYRLTALDGRHRITVKVTGSRSGYATTSATSAKTAVVATR